MSGFVRKFSGFRSANALWRRRSCCIPYIEEALRGSLTIWLFVAFRTTTRDEGRGGAFRLAGPVGGRVGKWGRIVPVEPNSLDTSIAGVFRGLDEGGCRSPWKSGQTNPICLGGSWFQVSDFNKVRVDRRGFCRFWLRIMQSQCAVGSRVQKAGRCRRRRERKMVDQTQSASGGE